MELTLYQVDAFTDKVFAGNPAAICPLEAWLEDDVLQAIAAENNLSETAFFVPNDDGYHLRWFTPVAEVDLCGHATLATASIIGSVISPELQTIKFQTLSGTLIVEKGGNGLLEMDFPSRPGEITDFPAGMAEALGGAPEEVRKAQDYMLVYGSEQEVAALQPDFRALGRSIMDPARGIIATAPAQDGRDYDFVSRFFAPQFGIDEDPVTGSAHCTLVPYWAERLGREQLVARQISKRGGTVYCRDAGERVKIAGYCAFYMRGTIEIP